MVGSRENDELVKLLQKGRRRPTAVVAMESGRALNALQYASSAVESASDLSLLMFGRVTVSTHQP